ncbi:hypothetical protein HSX11_23820 [Oxalobacteraceae bacterium]|nr:hypothetical protein [Oxalobacteraceae bacterium]
MRHSSHSVVQPVQRRQGMLAAACAALLALTVGAAAPAGAVCKVSEPNSLYNYEGSIDGKHAIRMTLIFSDAGVVGNYFYASQLKDIALKGTVRDGRSLTLDELGPDNKVSAGIEASFADKDPKGSFGNSELACEVIVGNWSRPGADKKLPVYLKLESITGGTLDNRYGEGKDEQVHANARRFRDAVKSGDKKAVASLLAYPISVNLAGKRVHLKKAAELIAHYDAIFTPDYRGLILAAVPRNMFSRDQGIMLGSGQVWFNGDGKVIALNN